MLKIKPLTNTSTPLLGYELCSLIPLGVRKEGPGVVDFSSTYAAAFINHP